MAIYHLVRVQMNRKWLSEEVPGMVVKGLCRKVTKKTSSVQEAAVKVVDPGHLLFG